MQSIFASGSRPNCRAKQERGKSKRRQQCMDCSYGSSSTTATEFFCPPRMFRCPLTRVAAASSLNALPFTGRGMTKVQVPPGMQDSKPLHRRAYWPASTELRCSRPMELQPRPPALKERSGGHPSSLKTTVVRIRGVVVLQLVRCTRFQLRTSAVRESHLFRRLLRRC
jgi:hypothetical protein